MFLSPSKSNARNRDEGWEREREGEREGERERDRGRERERERERERHHIDRCPEKQMQTLHDLKRRQTSDRNDRITIILFSVDGNRPMI